MSSQLQSVVFLNICIFFNHSKKNLSSQQKTVNICFPYMWSKMLSSSLYTMLKLSKMTSLNKLFDFDCVTLQHPLIYLHSPYCVDGNLIFLVRQGSRRFPLLQLRPDCFRFYVFLFSFSSNNSFTFQVFIHSFINSTKHIFSYLCIHSFIYIHSFIHLQAFIHPFICIHSIIYMHYFIHLYASINSFICIHSFIYMD